MSRQLRPSVWLMGLFCLARCGGTEADNPLTDVVVTPCKSSDEYDPEQLDRDFRELKQSGLGPAGASESRAGHMLGQSRDALMRQEEIPAGLSCVEWDLEASVLDVQIVNFSSSCGATLQGSASAVAGRVTIALDNSTCEVARCGNCSYDTATSIALAAPGDSALVLELTRCGGARVVQEWSLPLGAQPHGLSCSYAPSEPGQEGSAFATCGASSGESSCEAGLSCVATSGNGARCLPACSTDAECPLSGGTRCETGHCIPG